MGWSTALESYHRAFSISLLILPALSLAHLLITALAAYLRARRPPPQLPTAQDIPAETAEDKSAALLLDAENDVLREEVRGLVEVGEETGGKRGWREYGWRAANAVGVAALVGVAGWRVALTGGREWEVVLYLSYTLLLTILLLLRPLPALPLRAHLTSLLVLFLPASLYLLALSLAASHTTPALRAYAIMLAALALVALIPTLCAPYWTRIELHGVGEVRGKDPAGSEEHEGGETPEEPASLLSRMTFQYVNPFILSHYRRPIHTSSIPHLRTDDRTPFVLSLFRSHSSTPSTPASRPLHLRLVHHFTPLLAYQFVTSLGRAILTFSAPFFLRLILAHIAARDRGEWSEEERRRETARAAVYVAGLFAGQVGLSVANQTALFVGRRICIRLRSILISEIFTKALRRSASSASSSAPSPPAPPPPQSPVPEEGTDDIVKPPEVCEVEVEDARGHVGEKEGGGPGVEDAATEGKVLNLVSVDAFKVSETTAYIHYLFPECPTAIALAIFFLYKLLGPSALAGVACLVLFLPVSLGVSRLFVGVQTELLGATDGRLSLATEVLSNVRTVKFNAWEPKFIEKMQETRKRELHILRKRFAVWILNGILLWGTPLIVMIVTFTFHTKVLHRPLPADQAFVALTLFNILRSPLEALPDILVHVLQALVSCKRIDAFLHEPDTSKYTQLRTPSSPSDPLIGFRNATFTHSPPSATPSASPSPSHTPSRSPSPDHTFALRDLNFAFPPGKLSIVVGPVGSGKTTLLLSLLGETALRSGEVFMPSPIRRELAEVDDRTGLSESVAYCGQSPFLLGETIKENILFGSLYNKKRYEAVLDACALRPDLEIFDQGDDTEVGEKGTTCSGGQKARIALARALYSSARHVLLDDVLSAVDAHTAKHLYQHCLTGPLMKGRTVILVTHSVGLVLPAASFSVVMDEGVAVAHGSPEEVRAAGYFADVALADTGDDLRTHLTSDTAGHTSDGQLPPPENGVAYVKDPTVEELDGAEHEALHVKKDLDRKAAHKGLVKEEVKAEGSVSMAVYKLYANALGGYGFWAAMLVVYVATQVTQISTSYWLRKWAGSYEEVKAPFSAFIAFVHQPTAAELASPSAAGRALIAGDSTDYYLRLYILISLLYIVFVTARMFITFSASLRASRVLYQSLIHRVLGARLRFFDSTPAGRIINRLSKDIEVLDQENAPVLMWLLHSILASAAVLIVITFSAPAFLIGAIVITAAYWAIGVLYLVVSRELKRIESVTRSPIFSSFGEALNGVVTLRAYGDVARFARRCFKQIDTNNAPFWLLWNVNRWLSFRVDFVAAFVSLFASTFLLLNESIDAGLAGFALSYAISFSDSILWVVRLYSQNEINLNSVERIGEYLELEQEEDEKRRGIEPPAYWPSRSGGIVVEDLTARYAPELEPVLRGVTFSVKAGEKIGICGRTGSGKSTLALTLFRFLELDRGSIVIDGLDISNISLQHLRSRLTVIPQEAQLFAGTVRENLDPFGEHSDADIWDALRRVRMIATTTPAPSRMGSRLPSRAPSRAASIQEVDGEAGSVVGERHGVRSLDDTVAQNGRNYSAGQRQLLALARGLLKLRNSNILILDESTANLDHESDHAIQRALREEMDDVTILCVAHRLRSIADYDKILVLDAGRVLEFDSPANLLRKEGGTFAELCRRSGEEDVLRETAERREREKQKAKKEGK